MEGMLWKWTNYFSGWQSRWFVLEDGILSYYRSQEDVNSSCKGSIKVSACDVSVHSSDLTRLDLIVPGEAHFYVKAASQQERQQWLIALGTTKACFGNLLSSESADQFSTESLKSKKSELRLYCDLLMQQVYNVKCAVQNKDKPDVELLNESTALLGATCDTFIKTLDDCIHLVHANLDTESFGDQSPSFKETYSPTHRLTISKAIPWNVNPIQRQTSSDKSISSTTRTSSHHRVKRSFIRTLSEQNLPPHDGTPDQTHSSSSSSKDADQNGRSNGVEELEEEDDSAAAAEKISIASSDNIDSLEVRLPTFFTNLSVSFLDIRLTGELEIPTIPFLDACRSLLTIFDRLDRTAFAPGKLDFAGNVKKIHQKYVSSPESFPTLQRIILSEVLLGQSRNSNSATIALLWLNRTLQFFQHVMLELLMTSGDDVTVAANNAYKKTLMNYHGWVVRSAFSIAISSAPSRDELIRSMALIDTHFNNPAFYKSLKHDVEDQASAISTITHLLHCYLSKNDLDFVDQI